MFLVWVLALATLIVGMMVLVGILVTDGISILALLDPFRSSRPV